MKKIGLLCCLLFVLLTACNNHSNESDKRNEKITSEELKNNKAQESQKVQDINDKDVEETEIEVSEISTGVYYLNVPFSCNGSGMTCQLLIQLIDSNRNVLDFYFGNQDGVDTLATGHLSEREVKNPGLWEDTDWVAGVNERLLEYEEEIDSMLTAF